MRKIPFAGIELTSQRVRGLQSVLIILILYYYYYYYEIYLYGRATTLALADDVFPFLRRDAQHVDVLYLASEGADSVFPP